MTHASMTHASTWILIADAARARVVRKPVHPSDARQIPLETVFEASADPRALREIMADRPGRSFASTGARRSAMEYHSDPVREQTRGFAASLLKTLETRFTAGDFEELIICAPPRMLSALREAMPEELETAVSSEVAKDFTKLSEIELHEVLDRLAGVPE